MQRLGDWVIIGLLLVLAGYFYYAAPEHTPILVSRAQPLAVAERVAGFVKGNGLNYALSSGPFTGPNWVPDGSTLLPNAGLAPDGTSNAYRLVDAGGYGYHRLITILHSMVPGQVRTLSLFVKPAELHEIRFEMSESPSGNYGAVLFDLSNRAVVDEMGDVTDAGIQEMPDGWYRCWVAMPYVSKTEGFNFSLVDRTRQVLYRGYGDEGLLIWGAQFEPGSEPRGYVGPEKAATQ